MAKSKPKRHEIKTLNQLVNIVNDDNFERISVDFLSWLHWTKEMAKGLKEKYPERYKDKLSNEILNCDGFTWVDDGKTGVTKVELKNTDTGEVTEIKIKK